MASSPSVVRKLTAGEAGSGADYLDSNPYPLEFLNDRSEIIGEKKFVNKDKNDMSVIPDGEYRFGLYTENAEGNIVAVEVGGEPYIAVMDNDLTFKFEDLAPGTYYVYELDNDGEPIKDNSPWGKGTWTFETEYQYGNGIEIVLNDGNRSGTVMVINTVIDSYKLPETDGETPIMCAFSGMLLGGAALLVLLKSHLREQD